MNGFDKAIEAILGKKVQITVTQSADTVETGASLTGVSIGRLDLGRLLGPGGVEQAFIRPLRWIYEHGYEQKILLVIDSMDEAHLYEDKYKITDAVLELAKLNLPVRVLVTARDETDVLSPFRANLPREI